MGTTMHSKDENNKEKIIWLMLPESACPICYLEKRTILFTKYRIDILDTKYRRCFGIGRNTSATILKGRFQCMSNAEDLISLWERVTLEKVMPHQLPTKNLSRSLVDRTFGRNLPDREPHSRTAHYKSWRPATYKPVRGDAMWLMDGYLKCFYTHGGDFYTGEKEISSRGNGHLLQFTM